MKVYTAREASIESRTILNRTDWHGYLDYAMSQVEKSIKMGIFWAVMPDLEDPCFTEVLDYLTSLGYSIQTTDKEVMIRWKIVT